MGIRGELFSTKVSLQNRTYFFNVKENRLGDLYLNVVESKNRDTGGFERQSVVLFAEDLQEFLRGFDEALKVLEKAAREKRRNVSRPGPGHKDRPRTSDTEAAVREGGKRVLVKKKSATPPGDSPQAPPKRRSVRAIRPQE
ncbi:MAG: DUF3276 family protein [Spirochaetaceae bacterium]|nr:DUF3276 family protein [Spirochaetaceae bacterium]